MKEFFAKHKVFILGGLAAIAVVLQEFISQPEPSWKVVGFAAFMALLAFVAKEWRGQGLSIVGIVGNLAGVFVTIWQTGNFTWTQFALQAILAIIATAVPNPKSVGYEKTDVIQQAKSDGETTHPANLTDTNAPKL